MNSTKPGTVRQVRLKNPIKQGDKLIAFTGMRTAKCHRHGYMRCLQVYNITIDCIQKKIWLNDVELIPIIRYWFCSVDIQGPEKMFWDFFNKKRYKRPLVYICWHAETVVAIDQWLESEYQRNENLGYTGFHAKTPKANRYS